MNALRGCWRACNEAEGHQQTNMLLGVRGASC
jgi:hypothetical protein